jgi:hypothetical protein
MSQDAQNCGEADNESNHLSGRWVPRRLVIMAEVQTEFFFMKRIENKFRISGNLKKLSDVRTQGLEKLSNQNKQ